MVQVRLDNISSSETISNQNSQDLISSCEYSLVMEKQQGRQKLPRVSLRTAPFLSNDSDLFLTEKYGFSKAREKLPSLCHRSLDVLGSPMSAMEYLSHSWSPAASAFLHTSSSNNLLFPQADICLPENQEAEPKLNSGAEDYKQKPEMNEIMQTKFPSDIYVMSQHAAHSSSIQRMWIPSKNDERNIKRAISSKLRWRNWFGGKPVISFQGLSKGRRKEEMRLHTANIDAALSVVRLATAIASITGENDFAYIAMACGNNMNNVISCAATLVAAVCAEAAESVGAPRDLVASAVNSGMAAKKPADMIDLTVSAATCLRGAAAIGSRTTVGCRSQEYEELLNSGTPLPVVMPTGEKKERVVSIKLWKKVLLLIIARKCLGAFVTSKKYTIVDAMEGARGYYCVLLLRTNEGDMKLLFQEENQSRIWTSTVFKFLCNNNN